MDTAITTGPLGFQRPSLYRKYSAAVVAVVRAIIAGQTEKSLAHVPLGWGILPNGQSDHLGAWHSSTLGSRSAELFADDLRMRGTADAGLLINAASDDVGAAFLLGFPDASPTASFHSVAEKATAAASPSFREAVAEGLDLIRRAQSQVHAGTVLDGLAASRWRGCPAVVEICRAAIPKWQALYALSGRARAALMRGEDAAWSMQQGVSRAMARHGCFESAASAAAFAEAWLLEEEGRQRRRRVALRFRAAVAAARAAD